MSNIFARYSKVTSVYIVCAWMVLLRWCVRKLFKMISQKRFIVYGFFFYKNEKIQKVTEVVIAKRDFRFLNTKNTKH